MKKIVKKDYIKSPLIKMGVSELLYDSKERAWYWSRGKKYSAGLYETPGNAVDSLLFDKVDWITE